jgi:AcrR family transcriptional regulator
MASSGTAAPPQRPMRADARRNYQRLLDVARTAFAEHGVDASLDQIAKDAGVGPGTLYRHFPSREALIAGVFDERVERLADKAAELARDRGPGDALSGWLAVFLETAQVYRGLSAAMMMSPRSMSDCEGRIRAALGTLLVRAQESGDFRPEIEARDLLRLVHALALAAEAAPEDSGLGDRMLALLLDGLRAPRARPEQG